jgi:hypothetical protein
MDNDLLEITEQHEENFRPQVRVRVQAVPNGEGKWSRAWQRAWGHLSDEDLADDFHDAADRERIRKGGSAVIPFPYWENKDGVPAEPPFPDQLRDFRLRRTDAAPFLISLVHNEWLPLVWEVYAAARLPYGALVYVQTPEREWLPEGDGPRRDGKICPAWRLPWAFRCEFTSEFRSPAYIAADLLQVAVALLECTDPNAAKLRQRFATPNDEYPLEPIDVAVLVAEGTWKFASLIHYTSWHRDPRGFPPSSTYEGALGQRVARYGKRGVQLEKAAQQLTAEIDAGTLDQSLAAVERRLREIRSYSPNTDLDGVIKDLIKRGLLPNVRRPPGRPPKRGRSKPPS